ncbi:hypothetical protein RB195_024304 [Necator americanus]|uniref:DUF1758 domain-containing protein n=1 Tax=Necator americanus TaxID=51031 RepID=A0ABR1EPY7_NECAM
MSSTLKGKQAWLTRQGTQLGSTISKIEEFLETAETLPAAEANVGKVDLLVAQARTWNHRKSEFEEVYMILDTGADRSFISATYTEQLGLDETGTSQLKIRTLGSDTPIEKCCTTTCILIEDRRGIRHNITVAMVDFISGELQRTPLDEADCNYLSQHDISLSIPNRIRTVAPQILIGCGDLFDLFDDGFASTHELPSGLKALHSKIEHLVTGRNRNTTEELGTQVNNLCTVQSEDLNDELKEVDENREPDGPVINQLVVTPHKDTTKQRVVFDGSAHYKNAPCLNDKLHQRPVILPSLVDILNRFRIGNIAIVSDVEKAFLQVHLQAIDRDATRCLWVKDIDKPLNRANIVTYRFTRVTFGLNCSPFLLGATIKQHLGRTHNFGDREIANCIQDNVYVDNVIFTADTSQNAIDRCLRARQLFAEINMNLKESPTNSTEVNQTLPEGCLGANPNPKVLGIQWLSEDDMMKITCRFWEKAAITKRTVSEQVAAVYDPLGWLTPLMLKPKLFLQGLWKHKYAWDQKLTEEHRDQWIAIIATAQNFGKCLPRKVSDGSRSSPAEVVAFTDASKSAMATCVYLVQNHKAILLMAKSKLPSLKTKSTIPKLEVNALTMGTRLANSTYQAMRDRLNVTEITIFTDSEIALSWLRNPQLSTNGRLLARNRSQEIRKIAEQLRQVNVTVKFG